MSILSSRRVQPKQGLLLVINLQTFALIYLMLQEALFHEGLLGTDKEAQNVSVSIALLRATLTQLWFIQKL